MLFPVGVDTAKELIYSRLKITEPGPGFCHFPEDREDEYFRQLTAEKIITKYVQGRTKRAWVKTRTRNEALDVRVYALAALALMNTNINRLAQRFENKPITETKTETEAPRAASKVRRSQSGFVNGWR